MAYDMFRKKGLGFVGGGGDPLRPAPRVSGGGAAPLEPYNPDDGEGEVMEIGKQDDARKDADYMRGWDSRGPEDDEEFERSIAHLSEQEKRRRREQYELGKSESFDAMGDDEYKPSYRNDRPDNKIDPYNKNTEPGNPKREEMYDYYHGEGNRPGDERRRKSPRGGSI